MFTFILDYRDYPKNEEGDEVYPKNKNNCEYYYYNTFKVDVFARNRHGATRYARDAHGNEVYPRVLNVFLTPPVYARDALGNERYPLWKNGGERMIVTKNHGMVPARYVSGKQRYPVDARGNHYFPLRPKPYYLKDENDRIYLPTTVNNYVMALREEDVPGHAVYKKKDALGTTIYTEDCKMKRKSSWSVVGCLEWLK